MCTLARPGALPGRFDAFFCCEESESGRIVWIKRALTEFSGKRNRRQIFFSPAAPLPFELSEFSGSTFSSHSVQRLKDSDSDSKAQRRRLLCAHTPGRQI